MAPAIVQDKALPGACSFEKNTGRISGSSRLYFCTLLSAASTPRAMFCLGDTIRIPCGPERAGTARCCVALAPHMSYMRRSRALQRTAPAHSGLFDLPPGGGDGFLGRAMEPYRTYDDGARRRKPRPHTAGGAWYPDCIAYIIIHKKRAFEKENRPQNM